MKITIVGIGYVGLANAVLLAQHHEVVALDVNETIVNMINRQESHIRDEKISHYLANVKLNLTATLDKKQAFEQTDLVMIATPTNYDEETNEFDTKSVESVIDDAIQLAPNVPIVIKSTIPVGFTVRMRELKNCHDIIFSPEFLREGTALEDSLEPSRIIVGEQSDRGQWIAQLFAEGATKENIDILLMESTEAEAVKLFANTYLAMRVAYFNELDTYAEKMNLNPKSIIDGIGLDDRIGTHYRNPSFGYGGYCLPKDTKQLKANFKDVPNDLIQAIVSSNETRKSCIVKSILERGVQPVGIYRLAMKKGSDNFRSSAIQDVMRQLIENGVELLIYDKNLKVDTFMESEVVKDLEEFKKRSALIISNRQSENLQDVWEKVYTRDIYNEN